jgi:hypothetical protein
MHLDASLLTTFRSRFESKEPDPKNFVRRVTKLDVYLTVEDLVEERRSKGFTWEGIAEDFTALGVRMSVATLKTCFRRARDRKPGRMPRVKPPSRRTNQARRVPSNALPADAPAVAPSSVSEPVAEPTMRAATALASTPTTLPETAATSRDAGRVTLPAVSAPARPLASEPSSEGPVATPDAITPFELPASASPPGSREEMLGAVPQHEQPPSFPSPECREPLVDGALPAEAPAAPRRTYRSAITIRPEKPLSAFKENSP